MDYSEQDLPSRRRADSKKHAPGTVVLVLALLAGGCASQVPLISHTHIGHSLTGWVDTPGKKGLFETSEIYARRIIGVTNQAQDNVAAGSRNGISRNMLELESLIGSTESQTSDAYSFLRAFEGARQHIDFAIQSDDVSPNLRNAGQAFLDNSLAVVTRAELIKAVAQTQLDANTIADVVTQLQVLAKQIFSGEDVDGDGTIGSSPDEFGLTQLRVELSEALARETDPEYRPVEQRYLFGLVRLPDGTWKFRSVTEEVDGNGGGY